MTTYPLVQFVDSPATSAAVRFDFNDDTSWPTADAFDLGVPSLEGDPDGVGVEYGFRTLKFNLIVEGAKVTALQKQQALARELLRRDNWLMFHLDPQLAPVWFKTYRTQPGDVSLEHVFNDDGAADQWQIGITLTADPFAYGEREDLGSLSVSHDRSASTGVRVKLPEIKGDAPAPLRVEVSPYSVTENMLLGAFSGDYYWDEGDYLSVSSAGVDTTSGTDSSATGGTIYTTTFATNTSLASRVNTGAVLGGRFIVYARVKASAASTTVTLRVSAAETPSPVYLTDATQVTLGTGWRWVRLGDVATPYGAPYSREEDAFFSDPATSTLDIHASRSSASGALIFDCVLLVPVAARSVTRSRYLEVGVASHVTTPAPVVLVDGDVETVNVATYQAPWYRKVRSVDGVTRPLRGGFPTVAPGQTNRLVLLRHLHGSNSANVKTDTSTVKVSYHPRYLWLGA